jgi:hypothetical protein
MDQPEFPKDFLPHCLKVREAIAWHKRLGVSLDDFNPEDWCECEFHQAGAGMECQCGLFLRRPFNGHKLDEEFLPKIEEFYRKVEEYEKREREARMYCGAGI